ncbi:uncharacterized protein LOC111322703 isoform X2 [Stylophora pistillata]|uniref:uncharacterized protein LOC111322703 isoform X2 n=1 Tax=Stylophora pistillata TaxID=50429 RepID=UPI000C04F88A|nr:uncharacterized protein LOC111322703 isoform X2 [Stylophora pistillata]
MVDTCAWTSERRLVPRDQVEVLLSLLLKAEKRTWIANISPVNSSEHDDNQPDAGDGQNRNCSFVDTGSLLLRHGQCIKRIHKEFYDLDPRHYCVKVTAEITNPDSSSSQMQVVSGDDVNRSGQGISSSASSVSQDSVVVPLTTRTPQFELYKNAVLCAQYPVLGASQAAASPYSPASSPFEPPLQSKWLATGGAESQSCRRHESSESDNGHVSPEVSISTLSEELQELVRNVFELKRRQHKFYCETEIPTQVPRSKEAPRFLVEELLSQQVVLEHNRHPFYRVQTFMDNNIYDEWLIDVKRRIDSLIKGFWQYSRPLVPELPLESPKYHEQYVELMNRLFRYESKPKELHPVYHGAVPIRPLSSLSCQLLKEFSLRYGVGVLFCKLSYLEYFVKYFESNIWYIEHITESLRDVMNLILSGCQEIFVEEEFKMLLDILLNLLNQTKYSLSKIRRIFPAENNPNEGVKALVTLFELTLESARQLESEFPSVFTRLPQAQQFADHLSEAPACVLVASFVENEIEGRYERLKENATAALGQNYSMSKLLLKSILELHHEVSYYNAQYKQAFSGYFDIMKLSACKFYSLLMSDVKQLCENPPRNQRPNEVDCFMLCLAFRLSKLDKEWAEYIPHHNQKWRQPFLGFALQWLDATGHLLQRRVLQLISSDLWEPVAVIIDRSQEQRHKRKTPPAPRSGSVRSLTPSSHSAFIAVEPGGSPAKSSAAKEKVKSGKGKEPLPSREKSQKRTQRVGYDSSSEEDGGKTLKIRAQVNFARANGASSVKKRLLEPQTCSQVEATGREISPALSNPVAQPLSGLDETGRPGKDRVHQGTTQGEGKPAQSSEGGDSSLLITAQERQESTIEVHSPNKGTKPMGEKSGCSSADQSDVTNSHINCETVQPVPSVRNNDGKSSTSPSYTSASSGRQDVSNGNVDGVFHEPASPSDGSFLSKVSHSRNRNTPFENDSSDESDSGDSIHTSDSFDFIEDRGKAKVNKKRKTKTVQPVVDPVKSGTGRMDYNSSKDCQTCPARHNCFDSDDKRSSEVRRPSADKSKKSACIPVPRNKRIDKLRTSGASNLSECGSFQSASGSVFSRSTEGSYHSARSSPTPSQQDQSATQNDSDHHLDTSHSRDNTAKMFPISSSFVDVVGAVNRLAAFACHLCEILCTDEGPQRSDHAAATAAACSTAGDDDLEPVSLAIKRALHHRLVQVMLSFVKLYSDNVLGMDTCGLTDELLTELLGERVQRHLRTQRDERKIQGCRYNPLAGQSCNTTDLRGTRIPPCEGMSGMELNPGGFEPLTKQMGTRLTNVAILRSTLPWLLEHVTSAIANPDFMEYDLGLSYCETGPSLDGISMGSTAEGRAHAPRPTTDELFDPGVLANCTEHLCRLEISQVKLISYRINKLFKQLLRTVLDLNLPKYSMKKRLMPAREYLSRELQRFHGVLYSEDFNKFLLDLWSHVARNFEEECRRLVRRKSSASKQSHLLQQAVSYLMQFFYNRGNGLPFDDFVKPMDPVLQHLRLYTTSTDRLISNCHSFNRQVLTERQQNRNEELTSSVSSSSRLADANAPADSVIQAMRKDLHTSRKCFSGAALVEWVVNFVRNHGYDDMGLCIGSTETETGLELGGLEAGTF